MQNTCVFELNQKKRGSILQLNAKIDLKASERVLFYCPEHGGKLLYF